MSSLGYSNAIWLRFFRELGFFLRVGRETLDLKDRFRRERTQILNLNDATSATAHFTALTLAGVVFGTNTDEDGSIYVRFVVNGGNWDVNFYKATGASGLVAHVTALAASGTAALVADNSSGLSGSLTIGATIAAEANDRHRVRVVSDWKKEILSLWPSDGTTDDDAYSRGVAQRMLSDLDALEQQKLDRIVSALNEFMLGDEDNPVGRGAAFLNQAESTLLSERVVTDNDGSVRRVRTGLLEVLRVSMADEATGSEQDIIQRVVDALTVTFDAGNKGLFAMADHTPEQNAPIGTWRFHCVRGADTGDVGRETFDGVFTETNTDRRITLRGLVIDQAWKGPEGIGSITLTRLPDKTGDNSHLNLANETDASLSIVGETNANTDQGILYWKITANGATWDVAFYKSSARATGDKVAEVLAIATATAFSATPKNGSGLTVNWKTGSAPVTTTTGTLDLKPAYAENDNNVPDRFEFTTSLTSAGLGARTIQRMLNYFLNGDTSGSEQIDDDVIATANVSWGPYITTDN